MQQGNIAARAGRWSAAHWKTVTFGWLAFAFVAIAVGGAVGTNKIKDADALNQRSQGLAALAERLEPEDAARACAEAATALAQAMSKPDAVIDTDSLWGRSPLASRWPQPDRIKVPAPEVSVNNSSKIACGTRPSRITAASTPPSTSLPVAGSCATWPLKKMYPPLRMACEKGPAGGASVGATMANFDMTKSPFDCPAVSPME